MPPSDVPKPKLRLTVLSLVVLGLFTALFSRLWFLQVLAGERYADLAEANRVEFVVIEAPRGRILDREGRELVKNRPAQTVSADPRRLIDEEGDALDAETEVVLDRLSGLLGLDREEISDRLLSRKYSPFRAVPIAEDVPAETVFYVREHWELFGQFGIKAETLPVRTYPHGTLAAHLAGYLGEISEADLAEPRYDGYRPGDIIGLAGLERSYERILRGDNGLEKLEVNASGTVLRSLGRDDPIRGHDLRISVDLDVQRSVEQILTEGILASRSIERPDGRTLPSVAGAAVVLDPRNGNVVAMASYPGYDPAEFVGGVADDYWAYLNAAENQVPLYNRAVQSAYPPASTFKIVSAASALETGLMGIGDVIDCPPSWNLADITFRNWNPVAEGPLDMQEALLRSCDTVFYELGSRQWRNELNAANEGRPVDEGLQRMANAFGFGRRLGIDLPGESPGVVPGRAWRQNYWDENRDTYCSKASQFPTGTYAQRVYDDLCRFGGVWRGGDAVNMSIGQGDTLSTPLQIASAYAAIANGGTLFRPHLGLEAIAPDGTVVETYAQASLGRLPLTDEQIDYLQGGLERVVMDDRGTANDVFAQFPLDEIPVAGKTGTAEFGSRIPYAWFVAYAPSDDPEYVVAVAVEEGGGGSQTAAPITRRIFESLFGLKLTPFKAGPTTD